MTDDMPDSIERPRLFAALEARYQDPDARAESLRKMEQALANPSVSMIDVHEAMLRESASGPSIDATQDELDHVRNHWYGNGWYWDYLPADVGPLPPGTLSSETTKQLRVARGESRDRIAAALAESDLEEHERFSILRLMIGEEGAVLTGRTIDGEDRARVFAHGLVEFIRAI